MASSLAFETPALTGDITSRESFEGFDVEILEINDTILTSLLEDSQGGDHETEKLNDVIRSLEAEINNNRDTDKAIDVWSDSTNDFSWVDMDTVPSSPGDGMNWYREEFGDGMNNFSVEFDKFGDFYCHPNVYSMDQEGMYGSLWHDETCFEMIE